MNHIYVTLWQIQTQILLHLFVVADLGAFNMNVWEIFSLWSCRLQPLYEILK